MFGRNASCDAERAQDAADFGGEGGGARLRNRVIGSPRAGNPNFCAHLQDAIEGLYGTGTGMDKDKDEARRQMEVNQQLEDDKATEEEDDDLFARMMDARATKNNQQGLGLGRGHGGQ
jgi:hypothetical protein